MKTVNVTVGQAAPSMSPSLPRFAQVACAVLLGAGLLGILSARGLEQRAALITTLLNVAAALAIATLISTMVGAVAWRVLGKPRAQVWTQVSATTMACALLALGGLGASATVLRLEAALRLQVGPDFVFIGGAMPRSLMAQLQAMVHPSVSLNRVILSNAGGSIPAALETAQWLKQRGVRRAVIEGDCASACAVLALLLPERYLTPGAALGFHDLWGRNAASEELRTDRDKVLSAMRANGVDTSFIEPLMVGRELRYPDRVELLDRRLVTGCWSQTERAPEPCAESNLSQAADYEAR